MQDSYFGRENDSTFRWRLVNLFEEDDEFDSEDYGLKSLFEEVPDCIETSTIRTSTASTFSFDNDQIDDDDSLCLFVCLFVCCLSVVWVIAIFVSMIVNFFWLFPELSEIKYFEISTKISFIANVKPFPIWWLVQRDLWQLWPRFSWHQDRSSEYRWNRFWRFQRVSWNMVWTMNVLVLHSSLPMHHKRRHVVFA